MITFAVTIVLACSPLALLDFALPKWKADRDVRIEDAYKWLYQATLGGEHAVPDRQMAGEWLDREWKSGLISPRAEPAFEPLCPGGEVVRLNLRPYRAAGGKEEDVLAGFLASAAAFNGSRSDFTDAWKLLGKRLKTKPAGRLTYREWQGLDAKMAAADYPAIHHSESYNNAVHPAYRVITRAEMLKLRVK